MKRIGFMDADAADQILLKAKTIFNLTTGYIVKARKLENKSWDFFKNEKTSEPCENNFPRCDNVDIPVRQDSFGNLFLEFVNWNEEHQILFAFTSAETN